ncbi:MAG TPA: glycosyltransferase family 4 protein [Micropepsaceae bacterium]|nr:glycosyltransferase family 4 protein [Micropepsaceae bacterium]
MTSVMTSRDAPADSTGRAPTAPAAPRSREAALAGDRPLRILMPSYRSDPHTGGQGIYMRYISRALADLGHKVDVISGPPYPELDPRIGLIKLPSLDLYAKPKEIIGLPKFPKDAALNAINLREYITHITGGFGEPKSFGERLAAYMRTRIGDYDVVHDNQTLCWGLLDVARMGLPVAGTIHHPITMDRRIAIAHADGIKLKLLIRRWYSFLSMQKKVARRLDPVIVVSESTKRDVVKDFGVAPERMRVVHHGINADDFHPMPEVKRVNNRIMAVASADVSLKGLIYLIRAYAQLLPARPDLELLVVSKLREGPTSKLLDELGLRNRVRFVSGISNDEMRRLYAEATIAVSPSVYEGFGFPAGEALACGVPVIATDGGSLPEVVGDAGVIVPARNPEALAQAIGALLDDPDRRTALSIKGRKRIEDLFLWSRAAANVVAVYREAIARQSARQAA